ncbi:MAG TPA: hypothetical protein GXZ35_03860 [Acholeplasmataceae bacterium]|nr:hypothetical protein [Acholeplasmataceae bacterium]
MKKYRRDPIDDELVEIETEEENDESTDEELFDPEQLDFDSLEDLMKQFEKPSGDNQRPKNVKVINFPQRLSNNIYLNSLYVMLINIVIIFSFLGYTKVVYYQSILDVLLYALIFSVVEIFIKEVTYYYFPMIIFKSLGSILLAMTVLSFLVADVALKNITFISTSALVFFIVVFLVIRSTITNIIASKRIEKLIFGRKK